MLISSKFTTKWSLITYIGVGNRAYESRFTVSHMANGTDIDGGLARDDLWHQGRNLTDVEILQVLHSQMLLAEHLHLLSFNDVCLGQLFKDEGLLLLAF